MLDKQEVLEMLWNMNYNLYKRSQDCRERAELAELRGDDDSAEYWYSAADQDFAEAGAILRVIRAIDEM